MLSVCINVFLLFAITVGAPPGPPAASAFVNARILTANDAVYDPGALVIAEGKIVAVGPVAAVVVPANAKVLDCRGRTIIPGLVDTHSHLGLFVRPSSGLGDVNEMTGAVQSGGRALDAVYPFDPGIRMANAGGVTTANIMPGSGNVIGGQTIYVKLRGETLDAMRVEPRQVLGGLKMANGENPKRAYGEKKQAPSTRMKTAALQRGEFVKAREYLAKWDRHRQKLAAAPKGGDVAPEINLDLEPLAEVLQRKRTVHFHTHRADDILTAVRLADEFGFELLVQHGTESFKVADELAKRRIAVSMTVVDSPGGKPEVVDLTEHCGAELAKKNIQVMINTDDPITDSRFLLRTAASAVRGGLSADLALKAVTRSGARALHLDHRLGTLETGKDADFALLSGDPFSVYTKVEQTWIDGVKVFDLEKEGQRAYQTGGFGLTEERRPAKPQSLADKPVEDNKPQDAAAKSVLPTPSSRDVVVYAKRVHTVAKGTIPNGVVVVQNGKIAFVGPQDGFQRPPGAPVVFASDVTPGMIDVFSQVALSGQLNTPADQDQDEHSGPSQAELRVLDAFNPREPLLHFLLEQGVTVVHACPGRMNVIAGQTGVFRSFGRTAESMTVRFPQAMLFNLGNSVKGAHAGQKPGTRMGTASLIRSAMAAAAAYARKVKAAKEDARPDSSPAQEAMGLVLDKKIAALFAAHRADDLLTALRIAKEFNVRPVLALATEGYLVADRIAEAHVPVLVHPTMQPNGDPETINTFLGNAAVLADHKILLAIGSGMEPYVPKTRVVRQEAAVAMANGLGYQRALRAVTLDAAKILDIADRFGSLEVGKEGDLVVYDGDPFEYTTHIQLVLVGGGLAFSRADREAVPFARRAATAGNVEAPCCLAW